jgi:hypothetical protein
MTECPLFSLMMTEDTEDGGAATEIGESLPSLSDDTEDDECENDVIDEREALVLTGGHPEASPHGKVGLAVGSGGGPRIPPCLVAKSGLPWLSGSVPVVAGVLQVVSVNFQCACSGIYRLAEGMRGNGEHVWIQQTGSFGLNRAHCIYSAPNGKWCIGGKDTALQRFSYNAGFIYHKKIHGGMSPQQLEAGRWVVWDGSQFRQDASITVTGHDITSVPNNDDDDLEDSFFL